MFYMLRMIILEPIKSVPLLDKACSHIAQLSKKTIPLIHTIIIWIYHHAISFFYLWKKLWEEFDLRMSKNILDKGALMFTITRCHSDLHPWTGLWFYEIRTKNNVYLFLSFSPTDHLRFILHFLNQNLTLCNGLEKRKKPRRLNN